MSSWLSTSAIAGVVAFATWALLRLAGYGKREAFLPPGPPTKPLVGNMTIWPKSAPHLRFTEWASQYGEIYSLKLAHKTYVVLTSLDAIHDILGKQSALSSDRPPNHIRDCIEGQDNHLALGRNTPRWRALRRAAQQIVSPQACRDHLAIQQAESVQLVYDILQKPKVVRRHLQRYATSVIFAVMFGIRLPLSTTPLFLKFWEMLDKTTHLSSPTSHPPIDTFPILKYIPERWAPWKAKCRELKALQRRVLGDILGLIKDRLAVGAGNGCFMEEVYTRAEEWGLDEDAVLPFGFVMTAAGADTTATFLHNFVLFITKHPEVQQKAQEEITRVVGNDRMPELSDFANLPYLQAVINETHRLRPVASLAVPHAASEDIRYGNYVIPKGAVIFQNTWGLFHDPAVFPDPDTFYPERFIVDPELNEYVDYIFGSGRRYCVGVHLAQNSIRINTMNLLWAFNFRKILNEAGSVIELGLKEANQAGLVQRPEDFPVSIKPRSAHHEKVLRQAMKNTGEAFTPFEYDLTEEDRVYAETTRREACKEAGSKGGVS